MFRCSKLDVSYLAVVFDRSRRCLCGMLNKSLIDVKHKESESVNSSKLAGEVTFRWDA